MSQKTGKTLPYIKLIVIERTDRVKRATHALPENDIQIPFCSIPHVGLDAER